MTEQEREREWEEVRRLLKIMDKLRGAVNTAETALAESGTHEALRRDMRLLSIRMKAVLDMNRTEEPWDTRTSGRSSNTN